jgi:hypothetical protein
MRNRKTELRARRNDATSSEEHRNQSTAGRRNLGTRQPPRPNVPAGLKAVLIVRCAIDELRELAQVEKERLPRVTRLTQAIKRASSKVSLELVSLGLVYPVCMAVVAALVIGWFYLSARLEGTR